MKELRGILNEIERWTELNSKIEQLQAALRQISNINNNASIFNMSIHEVVAKELGDGNTNGEKLKPPQEAQKTGINW